MLKKEFRDTQSWEVCRNIILNFEQTYSRKYHSDWTNYLFESKLEDFYSVQGEAIVVSTIHKAKGKEFDNVFLLLNNTEILSDEKKREIYVAITRAKQYLSIHTNGHYLSNITNALTEYQMDNNSYPAPQSLCYTLTHKDLWLNFFIDSHCQNAINKLKSGTPLHPTDKGCTDFANNDILRFSKKFKDTINELTQKGYKLKEASVNFVVYWERQEDKVEARIILPKVVFKKA